MGEIRWPTLSVYSLRSGEACSEHQPASGLANSRLTAKQPPVKSLPEMQRHHSPSVVDVSAKMAFLDELLKILVIDQRT
jgi:hypothetical protein